MCHHVNTVSPAPILLPLLVVTAVVAISTVSTVSSKPADITSTVHLQALNLCRQQAFRPLHHPYTSVTLPSSPLRLTKEGESPTTQNRTIARALEVAHALAICAASFVLSFATGVMAFNLMAIAMAYRTTGFLAAATAFAESYVTTYQAHGLTAAAFEVANAVCAFIDHVLVQVKNSYDTPRLDAVVQGVLMGGRTDMPTYLQYPIVGAVAVPLSMIFLFLLMIAWRCARNMLGLPTGVTAAVRPKTK